MTPTPHPLLVPWSWKSRAIPLLPLLSSTACTEPQCLYNGPLYLYFTDLHNRYFPEFPKQVECCAHRNSVLLWPNIYEYPEDAHWNPSFKTLEPERRSTSSPSSILPAHSSHCDFIPTRKHSARLSQILQLHYVRFLNGLSVQLNNFNCVIRGLSMLISSHLNLFTVCTGITIISFHIWFIL